MPRSTNLSLRPELVLLLECSKPVLDDPVQARIASLAASPIDWAYVFALAYEQGVTPLMNLHLRASASVPPEYLSKLQQVCESHALVNLSMVAELFRVLEILRNADIQAIPYKGPALAVQAYGDLTLRVFSDLDLVLRHRDVMRACDQLIDAGYHPAFSRPLAVSGKIPGQYVFRREGSRIPIEIHTESTLRYFPRRLDLDAMSQRLESVLVGGREVFTFAPEDTLQMLCVHGSKHFWDHLLWIADIAALAARPLKLDWQKALSQARSLGMERMVLLGLSLAESMLGARFPTHVTARLRVDRTALSLSEGIKARYFSEDRATPAVLGRAKFRILMRGNPIRGIPYVVRLATAPTEEDWVERESKIARAFKTVSRPLRLLRKYGLGLRRTPPLDLARFLTAPIWLAERMLEVAELSRDDVIYDLGCGDGQIIVLAAKRYGSRGVGVDIDKRRLQEARARARVEGVGALVEFLEEDAKSVDISRATVVALFLGPVANTKLAGKLRSQLRPGARIVSGDGDIPGWPASRIERFRDPSGQWAQVFLWRVDLTS